MASKKKRKPAAEKPAEQTTPGIRDRIRELRRVPAGELLPHPLNPQIHGQEQRRATEGILRELGYADALIARELPDGRLQVLDGHLRREITPEMEVPVLIVDLDDSEAEMFLATHDPLVRMAEIDPSIQLKLLEASQPSDPLSRELIDGMLSGLQASESETQLIPIDLSLPPAMTWILLGIPTVRYGEIAETVAELAGREEIILETTSNNATPDR